MKKLEVKDLKENFFEAIGKEWMLVTAGTKEKFKLSLIHIWTLPTR